MPYLELCSALASALMHTRNKLNGSNVIAGFDLACPFNATEYEALYEDASLVGARVTAPRALGACGPRHLSLPIASP